MARNSAALLLALLLAGCGDPLPRPGSQSLGTTAVNGRVCRYYAADHQVEYVLVFDTRDAELPLAGAKSRLGDREVEDSFRTLEGQSLSVCCREPGSVEIDGAVYRLADGRVFLIRLARGGNACEQLPIPLAPRPDRLLDDGYVQEELQHAAAGQPRLASFLGTDGP